MLLPVSASATTGNAPTFVQNHQLWDEGPDILALQRWLNAQGFLVAQTGYGSPGNETTTFGLHTYHALLEFQEAHGLPVSPYERAEPLRRAKTSSSAENCSTFVQRQRTHAVHRLKDGF